MQYVKPQLAKPADKWIARENFKWEDHVIEMKLDGHRRLITATDAWSRGNKWHSHPHIQKFIPSGVMFDGELIPNDGEGSHVVSNYLAESPHKLKLSVFDVLWYNGVNLMNESLKQRRKVLERIFREHRIDPNVISINEQYSVQNRQGLDEIMDIAGEREHEGLMIKRLDAKYSPNSRSTWMKYKFVETWDVVITDCESKPTEWRVRPGEYGTDGKLYPDGRHSDPWLAGHVGLSYGYYDEKTGELRRVGSMGITGLKENMIQYIGRVAECVSRGAPYPDTGALKHASFLRWRDPSDKNAIDCKWNFKD